MISSLKSLVSQANYAIFKQIKNRIQNTKELPSELKKENINSVIPLKLYQTWHTKDLPIKMKESVEALKYANPEFEHFLFDDNDCREFIQNNFSQDVLNAFDTLIPGAYKADLWRYCILYINGGIYLDIKYKPVNGFKLIQLTDNEYFVRDRPGFWTGNNIGIYQGFLVCRPHNNILLQCINQIVKNVKVNFYGYNDLYPTGPGLMGLKMRNEDLNNSKLMNYVEGLLMHGVTFKNVNILRTYKGYRKEQKRFQNTEAYWFLWKKRSIYKK